MAKSKAPKYIYKFSDGRPSVTLDVDVTIIDDLRLTQMYLWEAREQAWGSIYLNYDHMPLFKALDNEFRIVRKLQIVSVERKN